MFIHIALNLIDGSLLPPIPPVPTPYLLSLFSSLATPFMFPPHSIFFDVEGLKSFFSHQAL